MPRISMAFRNDFFNSTGVQAGTVNQGESIHDKLNAQNALMYRIIRHALPDGDDKNRLLSVVEEQTQQNLLASNERRDGTKWRTVLTTPTFGNDDNVTLNPKAMGIFTCDGTGFEQWLKRINANCNQVTKKRWLTLLANFSSGALLEQITYFQKAFEKDENLDLEAMLMRINLSVGVDLSPQQARDKLRTIKIQSDEDIMDLEVRISRIAECAVADIIETDRASTRERLAKESFIRAVPPHIRDKINDRLYARRIQGDGEPTYMHLCSMTHQMTTQEGIPLRLSRIRYVSDHEDDYDENESNYQTSMKMQNNHINNIIDDDTKVEAGIINEVSELIDTSLILDDKIYGVNDGISREVVDYLDDDETIYLVRTKRGYGRIRASTLNVKKDECLKCGEKGHRMTGPGSQNCRYSNQPLTTACRLCRHGGHSDKFCHRARKNTK